MNVELVTVSSRIPDKKKTPYYFLDLYLESLNRFAIVPTILGNGEPWNGLMSKGFAYRKWLRAKPDKSQRVLLTDAWDIVWIAHPHGINDRCVEIYGDDAVVFNAEKGCWPRADLAEHFPDTGTPWRYLNSGFICGRIDKILAIFEAMDLESIGVDHVRPDGTKSEPNDQGEFQRMFVAQPVKMVVDGRCELAQTFSACAVDEFDFSNGKILNKATGTYPGCAHCNGPKEPFMSIIKQTLNLRGQ